MLESKRLLLNIKATHQQIIDIGKMALEPYHKAEILHNLELEKQGYEAAYMVARKNEQKQHANR